MLGFYFFNDDFTYFSAIYTIWISHAVVLYLPRSIRLRIPLHISTRDSIYVSYSDYWYLCNSFGSVSVIRLTTFSFWLLFRSCLETVFLKNLYYHIRDIVMSPSAPLSCNIYIACLLWWGQFDFYLLCLEIPMFVCEVWIYYFLWKKVLLTIREPLKLPPVLLL